MSTTKCYFRRGEKMENEIQLFSFDNQQVRTLIINDQPYFVGKDVAEILGYGDTNQAIRKHVDDEDKLTRQLDGSGQNRAMTVINESGSTIWFSMPAVKAKTQIFKNGLKSSGIG